MTTPDRTEEYLERILKAAGSSEAVELELLRSGMDTVQIANLQGSDEATVYNLIHRQREAERKRAYRRQYANYNKEYQQRYYLTVTKAKRAGRKEWDR